MGNSESSTQKQSIQIKHSVFNKDKPRAGYYITPRSRHVMYMGEFMRPVNGENTFIKLKYSYAKTNLRVFYKGIPIPNADPASFVTIDRPNQQRIITNDSNLLIIQNI